MEASGAWLQRDLSGPRFLGDDRRVIVDFNEWLRASLETSGVQWLHNEESFKVFFFFLIIKQFIRGNHS